MNNFATNARIAESRGIQWRTRAAEVAKLTVLQTEFPSVGSDLYEEPRLPSLLLDPPDTASPRLQKVLRRHGIEVPLVDDEVNEDAPTEIAPQPTDPPIVAENDPSVRLALATTQKTQLERYLERAANVRDPQRDLLYLEAAGAAVGLDDPELGETLEGDAPENPERAVAAVISYSVGEQRQSALMLADMSDDEFGIERDNVMRTLLLLVEHLGEDVTPVAHAVVESVKGYQRQRRLDADLLVGALSLALTVEAADDSPLVDSIFEDPELLDAVENVRRVALMIDRLPARHHEPVFDAVAGRLAEDLDVLVEPLARLPADDASRLFNQGVQAAVAAVIAAESTDTSDGVTERLYEVLEDRPEDIDLAEGVQRFLLDVQAASTYAAAMRHAPAIVERLGEAETRNDHALMALRRSGPIWFPTWAALLVDGVPTPEQTHWAAEALIKTLGAVFENAKSDDKTTADKTAEKARELDSAIAKASAFLKDCSSEDDAALTQAISDALAKNTWWIGAVSSTAQGWVHAAARHLRERLDGDVETLLVDDLLRATQPPRTPGQPVAQPAPATEEVTLIGLSVMGPELDGPSISRLYGAWSALALAADDQAATRHLGVLLRLAGAASARDTDVDLTVIDEARMHELIARFPAGANNLLGLWLALDPPLEAVANILGRTRAAQASARGAVDDWARTRDDAARTALARQLGDGGADAPWVKEVARHGVDEDTLTDEWVAAGFAATNSNSRRDYVDLLVALAPGSARAQHRVADYVINLLERKSQVDFELACRLADAVGTGHRSTARLKAAFVTETDKRGRRLTPKAAQALARANIKLPKKSFADNALSILGFKRR